MHPTGHTLRDDDHYLVVVGWDPDLETFYARVHDRAGGSAEPAPVLSIGGRAHEIPTISGLITTVSRFAEVSPLTISRLRREATPLSGQLDPLPEAG